ncbi:MAG: hypothetical protein WBP59_01665 [Ilumatobacteraceae bacterium]
MDSDRSAVYAAELAAFDGTDLEMLLTFDVIERRMEAVLAGEWWPGPPVVVRAARSDARSSSTRCEVGQRSGTAVIRLARDQLTMATAAHELAHALAGADRGHDALFRVAYLDVVAVMTNLDGTDRRRRLHVDHLAEAFDAVGLSTGSRQWSVPPPSMVGPIAL